MKRKPHPSFAPTPLRRRAETRLRERSAENQSGAGGARSTADTRRLLHELQVHQIELEMQNEELQKARDEMEAGMERFSDLYDFAPVGYFTFSHDGTIRQVNLTGAKLIGIERSRLVGQSFGRLLTAELRPGFTSFLKQVFADQTKQSSEFSLWHEGQPPRFVSIEARCSSDGRECRAVVADITEHKRAEDMVRVSEVRYRRLFETAHDGLLLLDPRTRKITDANPLMTKLLGYPRDQLVGKELFEIGLLKDEAASQAMFQKLTRKHEVRYEDLPLVSQGGRHQEVEVVANLYVENGFSVIQCNIRDITARKRTEQVLAQTRILLARHTEQLESMVAKRTTQLTSTNRQLAVSLDSTRMGEEQNRVLLLESQDMQKKLRQLTHQILTAQEEERKKISRELHDEVVQTLVGINVELSALVHGNSAGVRQLKDKIAHTQRLVESSVDAVHRFARDLRPAVLDDLGLIPALHVFCTNLAERKKLKIKLTAFGGVEALDTDKRTVLFRVTQEALSNVVRHAHATLVKVCISKIPGAVRLEISDNGKSFSVRKILKSKSKRLGLVGMRERVEMVGGKLTIESISGKGTTVHAEIPLPPPRKKRK